MNEPPDTSPKKEDLGRITLTRRVGKGLVLIFRDDSKVDHMLGVVTVSSIGSNKAQITVQADKRIIVLRSELIEIDENGGNQ